jgi:hypothetical protein
VGDSTICHLESLRGFTPMARRGLTTFLFVAREGDIESGQAILRGGDVDGTGAPVVSIIDRTSPLKGGRFRDAFLVQRMRSSL